MPIELKDQNMKLRMHNNNIRLRINPDDLNNLDLQGELSHELKTNSQHWNYKIILHTSLKVELNNDGFKFFIPLSDFESLKNNQVEQLNYKVDALKVNIEKEYACLHPASEQNMSNSDSQFFPRPNKENY